MNFHETTYGRRFFDAQLPHLIKALERIADGLPHTETAPPQGIIPDPNFLHDLYYGDYEPSVFKAQSSRLSARGAAFMSYIPAGAFSSIH